MTRSEFNALSKRARLRATLSRDAAYMVLVGGVRPGIAAREVGTTPQALTNTLRKLRDAMKESTAHSRTHAAADHHVGS
ncbi:hypothetical protein [Variovorax paradoxus]|uniref:TrfB transcriptional repressor protein domain-containing protein n=1 Tax=Variovorax paradoxus (strain EPS) TaxID=595537 RepID=E6V1P3_VARPE|nr:hypothetical protein [Variovorax paradoxus]ADU36799.1 hypothetical protein Varpa_2599 [Variovorax paradoxus EPS]